MRVRSYKENHKLLESKLLEEIAVLKAEASEEIRMERLKVSQPTFYN